jgi:hypothetical protein
MTYAAKEQIRVIVYTQSCRLEGDIYVYPGSRLTDMLNVKAKDFLALTNVDIKDLKEDVTLQKANFVAVARDSIVAVAPVESLDKDLLTE